MADKKYLDLGGVTKLWQLIKSKIPSTYASSQSAGGAADKAVSIPFGQVDGNSTATVFTATVDGITELRDGVCVYLKNGVITSASGFTLNINGLGAKPCYSTLAAASRATTLFNVNYTMLFVYNSSRVEGGCWDIFYGYDTNTNTIGYQLRTYSTTLPMTQKVYRYRLLFTSADGTHWVPANTSTSTNATAIRTVNQTKINPFGKIVYYGYTAAIDAEASPGTSYMWTQNVVTLGYSFNSTGAALELDAFKPIYLKCAPQSDGSAIIDADNPYVQTLPSTADGKIYIFLGIAVTATTVELIPEHPIYCYRNGGLQIWTGVQAEIDALNIPSASSSIPQALGTASPGNSSDYSRADHVHPMPSASDVGALPSNTTYVSTVNGQSGEVSVNIPSDYVSYSSQSLTDAQKTQARTNIGAGTYSKPTDGIPASDLASDIKPVIVQYGTLDMVNWLCAIVGGSGDEYEDIAHALANKKSLIAFVTVGSTTIATSANVIYDSNNNLVWSLIRNTQSIGTLVHSSSNNVTYSTSTVPAASSATPQALGTASAGSSTDYSRADHVHAMPSASDVGAIAAPLLAQNGDVLTYNVTNRAWTATAAPVTSVNGDTGAVTIAVPSAAADVGAIAAPTSPSSGAFLVYNGSAWVAQTLAEWQASSY